MVSVTHAVKLDAPRQPREAERGLDVLEDRRAKGRPRFRERPRGRKFTCRDAVRRDGVVRVCSVPPYAGVGVGVRVAEVVGGELPVGGEDAFEFGVGEGAVIRGELEVLVVGGEVVERRWAERWRDMRGGGERGDEGGYRELKHGYEL